MLALSEPYYLKKKKKNQSEHRRQADKHYLWWHSSPHLASVGGKVGTGDLLAPSWDPPGAFWVSPRSPTRAPGRRAAKHFVPVSGADFVTKQHHCFSLGLIRLAPHFQLQPLGGNSVCRRRGHSDGNEKMVALCWSKAPRFSEHVLSRQSGGRLLLRPHYSKGDLSSKVRTMPLREPVGGDE